MSSPNRFAWHTESSKIFVGCGHFITLWHLNICNYDFEQAKVTGYKQLYFVSHCPNFPGRWTHSLFQKKFRASPMSFRLPLDNKFVSSSTHNTQREVITMFHPGYEYFKLESKSQPPPPPTFLAQPASSQVSEVGDFLSFPALLSFLLTAISDSYRSGGQKRRENKDFVDYYGCKIPALTATIQSIP